MESLDNESRITISQSWINAQAFFEKETSGKLTKDGNKSLDDVIKLLEKRYKDEGGSKDDKLKQRAKAVAWNVLNGIKIIAEYAKPIADAVYQPAGWCLEATAFLLAIPGKIKDVFGGFAQLFESIQFFLVKFKILDRTDKATQLPRELVENTNELLISFVRMCALCYKPLAGGKLVKMKIALGAALLNDDQGIHRELENFDKLTSQQNGITHAVTLEHVLRVENLIDQGFKQTDSLIEKGFENQSKRLSHMYEEQSAIGDGVRSLILDSDSRKQGDTAARLRKDVERRLGENIVEITKKQETTIQECVKSSIAGSGSWLYAEGHAPELYQQWLDFESDSQPLLCISGQQNSGKSFVLAHILSKLGEKVTDGSRLAVAYYAFPKPSLKATPQSSAVREDPGITALRSLAHQIALKAQVYAQELNDSKGGKGDARSPLVPSRSSYRDCWTSLRLSQAKIDLTCVFLIDDIDQIPSDSRDRLIDLLSDQRLNPDIRQIYVRSVLTGSAESFEENGNTSGVIDLPSLNQSDRSAFITQELSADNAIADWAKDHQQMLKIFQNGPIAQERDFSIIKSRIARIKSAIEDLKLDDDIQGIMDSELEGEHEEVAKEIIKELNSSLKGSDIKELNEILTWVFYLDYDCDVHAMQELLEAQGFAEAKYLKRKLTQRQRYARLLRFDSDSVSLRSDELWTSFEAFEDLNPSEIDSNSQENPTISLDIKINNAPISHVRHFMWDLNKKLSLDIDFFTQAGGNAVLKDTIRLKAVDAHAKILQRSLEFLVEPPQEKFSNITEIVSYSLPYSLVSALEFEREHGLRIPNRQDIVVDLMALLTDVNITLQHWKNSMDLHEDWLSNHDAVVALDVWLRGQDAQFDPTASLRPADKRRLKVLVESSARYRYFHKLTVAIGKEWLQNDSWAVERAFVWVNGYLEMVKREELIDLKAKKITEENAAQTGPLKPTENPEANKLATTSEVTDNEEVSQKLADPDPHTAELPRDDKAVNSAPSQLDLPSSAVNSESDTERIDFTTNQKPIATQPDADKPKSPETANDLTSIAGDVHTGDSEEDYGIDGDAPMPSGIDDAESHGEDDENDGDDVEAEEELSDKEKIDNAVDWMKRELKLDSLGSLSLRRVAETYASYGLHSDAIKSFLEVIQLGKDTARTRRNLAYSYRSAGQHKEATYQWELTFQLYADSSDSAPKNDEELSEDHRRCAWSHLSIPDRPKRERRLLALPHYHESIKTSMKGGGIPVTYTYLEYIMYTWRFRNEEYTNTIFQQITEGCRETAITSSPLLTAILKQDDWDHSSHYTWLLALARRLKFENLLAGSLKAAFADTKEANLLKRMTLRLYISMVAASLDDSQKNIEDCVQKLITFSGRLARSRIESSSAVLIAMVEFANCLLYGLAEVDIAHSDYYIRQMELLARQAQTLSLQFASFKAASHLCWLYLKRKQSDAARALLLNSIKNTFDMLTDSDPGNDNHAYGWLADLLIKFGDDANVYTIKCVRMHGLGDAESNNVSRTPVANDQANDKDRAVPSAIGDAAGNTDFTSTAEPTLAGEPSRETTATTTTPIVEETGNSGSISDPAANDSCGSCEGDCEQWEVTWSMRVWICRCCSDTWFCDECLAKLRAGTLERFNCHKTHEHILMPAYDPLYRKRVPAGHVEVGARYDRETNLWDRSGCETIPYERWLDDIRSTWGIKEQSKSTS